MLWIRRFCESLRVDGTDHAALTMHTLRTVEPDWLCVHDADGVGQPRSGGIRGCRHVAGKECVRLVCHDILDRDAGIVESGLDNRVVLLIKSVCLRGCNSKTAEDVPWGRTGIERDHQVKQ
jgi:hypothetical protein